ncbi:MAG TPA: tyrosine-protein phosphatase [Candidatus Levilactobacillus faecigallinarum]|uniref:Tyrosine-protein phosphatase n=1 Tax=Candidatus Levilactobacillus faecigallinarum TaxID=2838638 RepID=A0A9D1QR24_9LACO|nr:tyrosine-protein phosphatase [Candidatus Levilactobacillus faecigallinarum]
MKKQVGTLLTAILVASSLGLQQPVATVLAAKRPATTIVQPVKAGKEIALQSAPNVRDLGGYVNSKGQSIKPHRLLRSAQLSTLTKADARKLAKVYHLKTDVDLRTLDEQKAAPDAAIPGVTHVSNPVFLHWGKASGNLSDKVAGNGVKNMETFYRSALLSKQGRKAYRTLFLTLLRNPNNKAVLWHCSAGKDRAGMGTMLILTALGFNRKLITKDYLLSNKYLAARNAGILAQDKQKGYTPVQLANAKAGAGVQISFLNAGYSAVDKKYGSMQKYLRKGLGLSNKQLAQLQKSYLTAPKSVKR